MSRLLAGAAKTEITPQRMGLRMGGHAVNRVAVGVRDPLYARAVAISCNDAPLVIVSLDLIGLMHGFVEKIRDRLESLERGRIWICTTHTHDSPDTIGLWGAMIGEVPFHSGLNRDYMDFLQEQVVLTVQAAVKAMCPAKIKAAKLCTPSVGLTRNVRQRFLKDDDIQILQLANAKGQSIAVLYNYACHPEFFGHHHRKISAGWPGVTNSRLENKLGGVALLVQNALGGMVTGEVTRDDGSFSPMTGAPFVTILGHRIADYILEGLRENGHRFDVSEINTAQEVFPLRITNRRFLAAGYMNISPRWMLNRDLRSIDTEVSVARIGPVVLATLPGEALPEVGFAVKKMLGTRFAWVLNLANDELGYLLPEVFWDDKRYGYEQSMSPSPQIVPLLQEKIATLLSSL